MAKLIGLGTKRIWEDEESVFVLSTGRTGTQTLAHLLALSPAIDAYHEPSPVLVAEATDARHEIYSNIRKYERIFISAKGLALFRSKRRGKIYAETSARLTFFAPVIATVLPKAKFIHIHRDPAAIVRSGMRRGWYQNHKGDHLRPEPVAGESLNEKWETLDQFSKICWYWEAYNSFAIRFFDSIASARCLAIEAEDLFSGTAVPSIFRFIGVPAPSLKQVRTILGHKLNKQQSGHFPFREEWTPEMHSTLQDIAEKTILHLGYGSRHA